MDGTKFVLILVGLMPLFVVIGTVICHCIAKKGAPDDAAAAASQDPHTGTKDGGLVVMGNTGEVVVEMATAINDVAGVNDSVTVGCCCGGGDSGDGGGCGGGCGGG